MTTFDHSATHMPSMARPAIVTRIANAVLQQLRVWKNRREVYRLGNLTNAELADIGLTRADLHVATGLPLGMDPTAHLGSLAQGRITRMEDLRRRLAR